MGITRVCRLVLILVMLAVIVTGCSAKQVDKNNEVVPTQGQTIVVPTFDPGLLSEYSIKNSEGNALDQDGIQVAKDNFKTILVSHGFRNFQILDGSAESTIKVYIPKAGNDLDKYENVNFKTTIIFQEVQPDITESENSYKLDVGYYKKVGDALLDGSDVKNAKSICSDNRYVVSLEFLTKGVTKFAQATTTLAPNKGCLGIFLDNQLITAPIVNTPISTNTCIIEGKFTSEEAEKYASEINSSSFQITLNSTKEIQ